ncbi:hydroxyisourate hydrolase [Synechococcus sp. CS-602]|uniref:hydroxyisourate hydrolase n=1 Tax=Synechococcaceae TaxID=1890426 RepID=UPI0008FF25A7|nr:MULTISPECIES: hydroxyisourate hydrolase [Synechococcaceae]MCT4363734.1 hydroxyisourate hydrolase [Candidatus Regnicoccus frigidus MAG-AL1]APD47938.1 hydroxyisourate hydrolase [Synechococcus sp. SynAce01]MCT0200971.1 hydroxyisourate hydrolase [Synechococcus sp. CS-603]MCT0204935.1 hydroxyisourate hydrolase [Synechococcus sp. CS-602]MCT0244763.1 hydroxyisourate hydrolase [Synechococcus sp. CS-601]
MLKTLALGFAMQTSLLSMAVAADNPLSVHVLNTQDGLPSAGVEVILERMKGEQWTLLRTARTNAQGRVRDLYPEGTPLEKGTYRVTFKTGEWLKKQGISTFFPKIPVIFSMDGSLDHYHVPLLLSPYGYSTYRGN